MINRLFLNESKIYKILKGKKVIDVHQNKISKFNKNVSSF